MLFVEQKVRWTSQSWGIESEKVGTIVCVVPPGKQPASYRDIDRTKELLEDLDVDPSNYRLSRLGGGYPRDHHSYLVAVDAGKTDRSKPWLYWPRVDHLETLPPEEY